ncbi:class I SAM-dependent methyltransferase [Paenibacillus radicis (ex Xue et al. 2023)]|uniref:Class I SAM-dependent methyltransferase n=1 Tax=Paenibacillus radicis (ex Xue et al. 2023) TaxID=2972489 RepID=A0ABT1YF97_9BACL|nr:class I SAM-dependent methyltransferase [Paenibacillus radicis (ex Xue et al. 2023)]MCR8631870.1 class I SAM-dependent methyltransferase [Paenibacillus radicis (ex Xue et al. 2023)]
MQKEQNYWNQVFAEMDNGKPVYDNWLDKHTSLLELTRNIPVIDLGCGVGCDTLYLSERGFRVISCDLSEEALQRVQQYVPNAVTMQVNLLEKLPFESNSAMTVIADLSLHYFSWSDTGSILAELQRVLQPGGNLLCRLNSVHDVDFGAGQGIEIELNYYEHEGRRKRFFNEDQVDHLFEKWRVVYKQEAVMTRYRLPKQLWEIVVTNTDV